MTKNVIEEQEKRLSAMLNKTSGGREAIERKIEEATRGASAAKARMDEATMAGDVAAYRSAKAIFQGESDAIEMYRAQRDGVERKALLSPDEFKQELAILRKAVEDARQKAIKELLAEAEKMEAIGLEYAALIVKANKNQEMLRKKVFKSEESYVPFTPMDISTYSSMPKRSVFYAANKKASG